MSVKKKVIVVGGVAGGASVAARLRRLDESLEIMLFEKDQYVSFANCGLPYHIGGVIKKRDDLLVQTPQSLTNKFNLDVRTNCEVVSVHAGDKTVDIRTKDGQEYTENYDYLVLSPGAKPFVPNIRGIDNKRLFVLRNMDDMDKIKQAISEFGVKSAVVVGGGFVGVESAENLCHLGIKTTLVEAAKNILAPFDHELAHSLECEMGLNGVDILTNEAVVEFKDLDPQVEVVLQSSKTITADLVVLCIGVAPDTKFLAHSGIALSERGHILVDDYLQTNIEGVYAVGDAILVKNYITKKLAHIPLAGPANRQARIAANNICGIKEKYIGSLGTSILKVFSLQAGATGINEKEAIKQDIHYQKIFLHPMDHASYYPGATPIHIKLLFETGTQKVLGAQAVGVKGVDKFIDVIATALKFKATLQDLAELELAYAPPFLSAKSPANMAGFIGLNVEQGLVYQCFMDELDSVNLDNQTIVDVREEIELTMNPSLPGSINLPLSRLRKDYHSLSRNKEILVYCAVGLRGYLAARFLTQKGFKVKNISGGISSYPQCFKLVEPKA